MNLFAVEFGRAAMKTKEKKAIIMSPITPSATPFRAGGLGRGGAIFGCGWPLLLPLRPRPSG